MGKIPGLSQGFCRALLAVCAFIPTLGFITLLSWRGKGVNTGALLCAFLCPLVAVQAEQDVFFCPFLLIPFFPATSCPESELFAGPRIAALCSVLFLLARASAISWRFFAQIYTI